MEYSTKCAILSVILNPNDGAEISGIEDIENIITAHITAGIKNFSLLSYIRTKTIIKYY
jgi:hypothetical protein